MKKASADAIDDAWSEFERSIQKLGGEIRSLTDSSDAEARFGGYQAALALVADNYFNQVYADRRRPEFMPFIGLGLNYAAPAPEMSYHVTHIHPGASYRVWGKRGDAKIIDVQHLTGWYGASEDPRSIRTTGNHTFESKQIKPTEDGSFEFVMSPNKPSGDYCALPWWRLEEGVSTLIFREIFEDYAREREGAIVHFEPIGDADISPENVDDFAKRLRAMARSVDQYLFCFRMGRSFAPLGSNKFRSENFGGDAGQSDQLYIQARYELPEDGAIVGEWKIPAQCQYWSLSLYTDLYQSHEYADHQVNLNAALAHVDEDGVVRFVLSREDPGVQNWLDCSRHRTGILLLRAKNAPVAEDPIISVLSSVDLKKTLSALHPISIENRRKMLRDRREHYLCRSRL